MAFAQSTGLNDNALSSTVRQDVKKSIISLAEAQSSQRFFLFMIQHSRINVVLKCEMRWLFCQPRMNVDQTRMLCSISFQLVIATE